MLCHASTEIAMFLVLPFVNDDNLFPAYDQGQYYFLTALIMFTLFGWGYAFDIRLWLAARINYAKVFGLKGHYVLRRSGIARLSAVLASFQLASAVVCFALAWREPDYMAVGTAFLIAALLVHICFFLSPKGLHPESRLFLGKVLLACFCVPFAFPVTFVANVVADVLTSAGSAIYRFQYGLCALFTSAWLHPGISDDYCGGDSLYNRIMLPLATALPFWLRFMQCMSRYFEALYNNKRGWDAHQHFVNALKYVSALMVVITDTLTRYHGGTGYHNAWVAALIVKTVYCYLWDVMMDWGLWRTGSPFALRTTTMFPRQAYYFAMLTNAFGRVAWAFGISPHQYPEEWTLVLQTVEVLRRIQWLIFRVENEYIAIKRFPQKNQEPLAQVEDANSSSNSEGDDPKH